MLGYLILGVGICATVYMRRNKLADIKELIDDGRELNRARQALGRPAATFVDASKARMEIVEKTGEILWDINKIIHRDDK